MRYFVVAAIAACAVGCSPSDHLASVDQGGAGGAKSAAISVHPMCAAGCQDPDPDPTAPGYYYPALNSQWGGCTADGVPDADEDGLSDLCENNLAAAFAPEMSFLITDDVRRETRWVAQAGGDSTVFIAYLLSYWYDNGDTGSSLHVCQEAPLHSVRHLCGGHPGDSEAILLGVRFSGETHHWYLSFGYLSQHADYGAYVQFAGPISSPTRPALGGGHALTFPDRKLGYPLIWAADGKHANYADRAECDDGGYSNSDDCEEHVRVLARVDADYSRNAGAQTVHLIDCVQTDSVSHPQYSHHYTECYWTNKLFGGWWVIQTDPAITSYHDRLQTLGFIDN